MSLLPMDGTRYDLSNVPVLQSGPTPQAAQGPSGDPSRGGYVAQKTSFTPTPRPSLQTQTSRPVLEPGSPKMTPSMPMAMPSKPPLQVQTSTPVLETGYPKLAPISPTPQIPSAPPAYQPQQTFSSLYGGGLGSFGGFGGFGGYNVPSMPSYGMSSFGGFGGYNVPSMPSYGMSSFGGGFNLPSMPQYGGFNSFTPSPTYGGFGGGMSNFGGFGGYGGGFGGFGGFGGYGGGFGGYQPLTAQQTDLVHSNPFAGSSGISGSSEGLSNQFRSLI